MSYSTAASKRKLVLFALLTLYSSALLCSMAGMEIFGWTLVAASLAAVTYLGEWRGLRAPGMGLPILGFFLSALISDLINGFSLAHIFTTLGEFRWIVLFYAIIWSLKDSDFVFAQKKVAYWLLALFAVEAALMTQQFYTGVDHMRPGTALDATPGGHFRAQGLFNICITTAYALGVPCLFFFGRWLLGVRNKLFYLGCFVLGSWCVFLSFTRGAWIAWFAAILAGVIIARPKPKMIAAALATVLAIAAAAGVVGRDDLAKRVTSIADTSTDVSNTLRLTLWKGNLQIFKDHPLFGVGWNQNSEHLLEAYAKIGHPEASFLSHSHNNLLQTLGGLGLVGFFFYAWLCLFMLWKAARLAWDTGNSLELRAVAAGSFAAQVFFHVGGMTQCNFIDAEVQHNLVFVWAMTYAATAGAHGRQNRI